MSEAVETAVDQLNKEIKSIAETEEDLSIEIKKKSTQIKEELIFDVHSQNEKSSENEIILAEALNAVNHNLNEYEKER